MVITGSFPAGDQCCPSRLLSSRETSAVRFADRVRFLCTPRPQGVRGAQGPPVRPRRLWGLMASREQLCLCHVLIGSLSLRESGPSVTFLLTLSTRSLSSSPRFTSESAGQGPRGEEVTLLQQGNLAVVPEVDASL